MSARQARLRFTTVCALTAVLVSPAFAEPEPTELINQQHCMFCHTIDEPFLAPSFRQIAHRYRDKSGAVQMLERKLRVGGQAHWGNMPMPPSSERGGPLSPEDAHKLVDWVLSQ